MRKVRDPGKSASKGREVCSCMVIQIKFQFPIELMTAYNVKG